MITAGAPAGVSVPTSDGFGRGVLVFFIMFIFLALMKWEVQIRVYRTGARGARLGENFLKEVFPQTPFQELLKNIIVI
jgi:hypothetical protein